MIDNRIILNLTWNFYTKKEKLLEKSDLVLKSSHLFFMSSIRLILALRLFNAKFEAYLETD